MERDFGEGQAEIGRRMGRKNVRTDDPTERIDTKILEVVLELEDKNDLVPGLRLIAYARRPPRVAWPGRSGPNP